MKDSILVILSLFLSTALASPSIIKGRACDAGVHIIVARASTEQPGTGIIGAVATDVASKITGSTVTAVDYPATLTNYTTSEASGVAAMSKLVQEYGDACPTSKMVVMGYSQGAQVVGDVLCGTGEANFANTTAIDAKYTSNIIAVIQMGDPSHVLNQTGNVGNSTKNAIFPRQNVAACASTLNGKTQAYCDSNDRFCDAGNSTAVHIGYVKEYGTAASDFVVSKWTGV